MGLFVGVKEYSSVPWGFVLFGLVLGGVIERVVIVAFVEARVVFDMYAIIGCSKSSIVNSALSYLHLTSMDLPLKL